MLWLAPCGVAQTPQAPAAEPAKAPLTSLNDELPKSLRIEQGQSTRAFPCRIIYQPPIDSMDRLSPTIYQNYKTNTIPGVLPQVLREQGRAWRGTQVGLTACSARSAR